MTRKLYGTEKCQSQALGIRDDFLEEMLHTMNHKYDGGIELIDKDETHKHENIFLGKTYFNNE